MTVLLLSTFVAAATILMAGPRLGRRAVPVAALPLAGAAAWLIAQTPAVLGGATPQGRTTWVGSLGLSFSFRLDGFALLMGLVVTVIGVLVLAYAGAYFGADVPGRDVARFAGLFTGFGGAMLGLVLADDAWTLFVFWEVTSVASFLLIGLDDRQAAARASALRALLVTGAGGLALLGGLVLVTGQAGTTSLSELRGADPTGAAFQVGLALVLLGAFTKSAQWPFHFWLPGAMAAPTPVSAYLHSATMVKAGVVLVARLAPLFASLRWWTPLLVGVGCATMLVGGVRALRQHDAKLLLAHGTVSQLGLLMVLLGCGIPGATAAGVAVLLAHAACKAALFLVVGAVDHATGTRDVRRLSGVGRDLPLVAASAALAAASMAGLPPLLGFVAKEAALAALIEDRGGWARVAVVGVAVGSVLTVAYTVRFWVGVFGTKRDVPDPATVHHRPSALLVAPIAVLAGVGVAGGLGASLLEPRLAVAGRALDPGASSHLALWAGWTTPLGLSAAIVATGVALGWATPRLVRFDTRGWPSGERTYQRLLDGLMHGARRVTGLVQNGSLPAYLAVTFVVVVAALAAALARDGLGDTGGLVLADSAPQAAVAALAVVLAAGVVGARRRFTSVLLLGAVGYALALIFLLYGAPDLALTQLLVETLMIVVFLLVLRHLPEGYAPPPSWAPRAVRLAIAGGVGIGVAAFAFLAGTAGTDTPVTDEIAARSWPEAGGRNLVNVILVDVRGIDTLGEITVLGAATVGVANLVRAARRAGRARPATGAAAEVPAGPDAAGAGRSVVFDEVARMIFPVVIVVSIYIALRGHNAPGGGFAGGLVAGAACMMRHLSGGAPRLARRSTVPATALIGLGLLVAVATGLSGLIGGAFLESGIATLDLPVVGPVKLVSSAAFDVGVYVLVLGVALTILDHLGGGGGAPAPPPRSRIGEVEP